MRFYITTPNALLSLKFFVNVFYYFCQKSSCSCGWVKNLYFVFFFLHLFVLCFFLFMFGFVVCFCFFFCFFSVCVVLLLTKKFLFLWLGQESVLCVLLAPFVCILLLSVYLRFGCLLLWLFCSCQQVLAVNQIPFLECRQLPEQ